MSPVALGCALALALGALALAMYAYEHVCMRVDDLEGKVMALEVRQARLQRMVEKGWSDTLDLTAFDWSRQSQPPEG